MHRIWQKEIETMPHTQIKKLQLERLQWSVKYTYDHVLYYRKKMEACKIHPESIKTLTDLQYLPYTTKQDLQEQYPFDTFAQPKKNIVRIQGSSGTHGKPTIVGYTKNDLNHWSDLVAKLITSVGVTDMDIAQVAFQYGLFTGAFGLHQGLEKVGTMVVPLSSGNTERQLMLKEAMPLIRYRTGDLTSLNDEPCQCGRTHIRMEQVKGRIDDMLVWKGVNIFPTQVESAIKGVDGITPHYQLIVAKEGSMQTLTAQIEVANNTILCETGAKEKLISTLEYKLKGALGVRMKVELLAGNSLKRTSGKSKRIIHLC